MSTKPFRALYFTDLHLCDRDISTRLDRSSEAALSKLSFACMFASSNKLDAIISGGDLTSDKIDSDEYISWIERAIVQSGVKFYTGIGNHDVSHRLFENYKFRTISILEAAEVVEVLRFQLIESLGILGINAYDETYRDSIPGELRAKVVTIFAHHYVNAGQDRLVLQTPELKRLFPNLRYLFTGHDHSEYPDMVSCGVTVYRPGGALRVSTAAENVKRAPKALLLEFGPYHLLNSVTPIQFPCEPAEKVFDLEAKVIVKSSEAQFEEFTDNVAQAKATGVDVEAVIAAKLAQLPQTQEAAELVEDVKDDYAARISA